MSWHRNVSLPDSSVEVEMRGVPACDLSCGYTNS
jgi:hypothetical protein